MVKDARAAIYPEVAQAFGGRIDIAPHDGATAA